ncbi:WXG100 family type VII secretion target [Nocardia sp. NPDC052316]|uniref:WXG100 family type VII secretion target n=1 Tax=Nocardia sp. NPDC052316 TaxID=3364329 RepID=UPI0037C720BB
MTDRYRVDLAHLDAVTAKVASLTSFVTDSLTELDQRIATVQSSWNGAAADAHATAHAEWVAAATRMTEGLDKMRAAAAAARNSYESGTAANLAMLGRGGQVAQ